MSAAFSKGDIVRRKEASINPWWLDWTRDRKLNADSLLTVDSCVGGDIQFVNLSGTCMTESFELVLSRPTTGRISSAQPAHAPQLPKAPTMTIKTPEELRAEADAAQAAIEGAVAKKVKLDAISADIVLADATTTLLGDLHRAVSHNDFIEPSKVYATFRKQLSPVAETYGYKIVLVGDKTRATLVQA